MGLVSHTCVHAQAFPAVVAVVRKLGTPILNEHQTGFHQV
jgi:hypothetical protein